MDNDIYDFLRQYGRLFVKVNGPKDETRTDQYILEISSSLRSWNTRSGYFYPALGDKDKICDI